MYGKVEQRKVAQKALSVAFFFLEINSGLVKKVYLLYQSKSQNDSAMEFAEATCSGNTTFDRLCDYLRSCYSTD